MFKAIFKEIIIILLLILAIILLLGILFYDYMPNSKVVPTQVEAYTMSADIQEELQKEVNGVNSEEVVKTYVLDATDLEVYERKKEYNKGKVNPFAQYSTNATGTSNSTTGGGTSGGGTSGGTTSGGNNNTNTSSGTFLNTTGK